MIRFTSPIIGLASGGCEFSSSTIIGFYTSEIYPCKELDCSDKLLTLASDLPYIGFPLPCSDAVASFCSSDLI